MVYSTQNHWVTGLCLSSGALNVSRGSSVRTATGYALDDRGGGMIESRWGQELLLLHILQTGSGVHPTSYLMAPYLGLFPQG
jgi:hypothetical protein